MVYRDLTYVTDTLPGGKGGLLLSLRQLVAYGVVFAVGWLAGAAVAAADVTLPGGFMALKSTGESHYYGAWNLWADGYVGTFLDVSVAGPVTVTIRAEGQWADGQAPEMDLHIGDNKATWLVADNGSSNQVYSDYQTTFNLPVGIHGVRVEFNNDYVGGGEDRNLYIKEVVFGGAGLALLNNATDANALAAADGYIQNYRRGSAVVTLNRGTGGVVPVGTAVSVSLRRHAFNFGTCVSGTNLADTLWVRDGLHPSLDDYKYAEFLRTHFNMLVTEYAGKWLYNEEVRDVPTMETMDAILDFAEENDMDVRAHNVLWDKDEREPAWVNAIQNQSDKWEYRAEISERIQYYVANRAHRYKHIDGINETAHAPLHTDLFGISGVADLYNEMVTAAAGQALVFTNDYDILTDLPDTYANWYRGHVQEILDAGGTVDGVGAQTRMYGTEQAVVSYQKLQNLAGFERPVALTELDCADESTAPDILSETFRVGFGTDQVQACLVWGFWAPRMNQPRGAMVDEDWNLTPTGVVYEALLAEWHTAESLTADGSGQVGFTGFYGDYDVVVDGRTYPLSLEKGTTTYELLICLEPTGDFECDGDVDLDDMAMFMDCMAGPEAVPGPTPPVNTVECLRAFDIDQDDDIDLADFGFCQAAFDG